jgi:hypothetical protein
MRYRWGFIVFFVALGLGLGAACLLPWSAVRGLSSAGAAEADGQESDGPPPLVVDKDAPLLLLDEPEKKQSHGSADTGADNSMCLCCHMNYDEEPLAATHASHDIGCIKCHGESLAHRDDEDNVTPPDTMYWPERIDPACRKCHDSHEAEARDVIARWQERCPAKTDPQELVCTDCHGQHRLKFRTVWWDKKTGELVVRDEGEVVKPKKDLSESPAEEAGQ